MSLRRGITRVGIPVALFLIWISLNWSIYSKIKTKAILGNMEVPTKLIEKQPQIMSSTMKERIYGIMNTKPIQFLPNFKNPCWYGSSDNGPINDSELHCLPFFYLTGVKKSGTTDLFARISAHPEFAYAGFKEAQWFNRRRFYVHIFSVPKSIATVLKGKDKRGLEYYVSMFDIAAQKIKQHPTRTLNNITYYTHVTGFKTNHTVDTLILTVNLNIKDKDRVHHQPKCVAEGTPDTFHMNYNWEILPGNEGLVEPRYTNFHYIKHLVPDVKILMIFRDPVDRLYSDYNFVSKVYHATNVSQQTLHARVQFEVETYTKCFQQYSKRRCIYNNTLFNYSAPEMKPERFAFNASFYSFYMKEWLSVFRKDQILPILMLDYIQDKNATLAKIFDFLGLSKLDSKEMNSIVTKRIAMDNSKFKNEFGPMLEKTKQLLRTFLKPFNEDMAELMNDSRYLFNPNAV